MFDNKIFEGEGTVILLSAVMNIPAWNVVLYSFLQIFLLTKLLRHLEAQCSDVCQVDNII
jgi:hypothetical protein